MKKYTFTPSITNPKAKKLFEEMENEIKYDLEDNIVELMGGPKDPTIFSNIMSSQDKNDLLIDDLNNLDLHTKNSELNIIDKCTQLDELKSTCDNNFVTKHSLVNNETVVESIKLIDLKKSAESYKMLDKHKECTEDFYNVDDERKNFYCCDEHTDNIENNCVHEENIIQNTSKNKTSEIENIFKDFQCINKVKNEMVFRFGNPFSSTDIKDSEQEIAFYNKKDEEEIDCADKSVKNKSVIIEENIKPTKAIKDGLKKKVSTKTTFKTAKSWKDAIKSKKNNDANK
ncbi:hypothetical protein EDEG_01767 [Edhazardia aedis USNM 41457]|uniref:Uncharacterized protein n=1 Tax=Edhazardia aedis (strain USNM 41457) TaxID=1003232 RepID=J9D825_EDHAE|nr:hypothetical protein EDEG_01767 [Edhazardia aedis USNM 41457]|eukprot:EJW03941.1 hypothetical protein EDEG_01767 [Edhazardia aedis USNM 41457]